MWLSDVIYGISASAPTRTKLNGHTTQPFNFTLTPPNDTTINTTLTFRVLTSDQVSEGSRQATEAIADGLLIEQGSLGITFEGATTPE